MGKKNSSRRMEHTDAQCKETCKGDKPRLEKEINQNQGECYFFKNLVPQARKRVNLMPENTLLANQIS
jgi:hypothetical protein